LAKAPKRTATEPPRKTGGSGKPETPMPTGSGVLGSPPRPEGASAGMDLEAAERRRFQRAIKEKT
jgi:hypothetical protein